MNFTAAHRALGITVAAVVLALAAPHAANAGTSGGTVTVTASVADNCTVGSPTLAFGAYDPLVTNKTTDLTGSASLSYACVKDPGHTIWIDLGQGGNYGKAAYSATYNAMAETTNGTDYMAYQLYQDAGYTLAWGSGDPGASATSGKGVRVTSPGIAGSTVAIYGLVPHAQDVTASTTYQDSVAVTINF